MSYGTLLAKEKARKDEAAKRIKPYQPEDPKASSTWSASRLIMDMIQRLGLEGLLGTQYTDWLLQSGGSLAEADQSAMRAEYGIEEGPGGASGILDFLKNWLTSGPGGSFSPRGNVSPQDTFRRTQKIIDMIEYYQAHQDELSSRTPEEDRRYRMGKRFYGQRDLLEDLLGQSVMGSPFSRYYLEQLSRAKGMEQYRDPISTNWLQTLLILSGLPGYRYDPQIAPIPTASPSTNSSPIPGGYPDNPGYVPKAASSVPKTFAPSRPRTSEEMMRRYVGY